MTRFTIVQLRSSQKSETFTFSLILRLESITSNCYLYDQFYVTIHLNIRVLIQSNLVSYPIDMRLKNNNMYWNYQFTLELVSYHQKYPIFFIQTKLIKQTLINQFLHNKKNKFLRNWKLQSINGLLTTGYLFKPLSFYLIFIFLIP